MFAPDAWPPIRCGNMTAMASSPTVQKRDLGARLRRYRNAAGMTGEQAGLKVEQSGPWISHLENGNVGIKRGKLLQLLDVYGVTDPAERAALVELALGGRERGWWARYASVLSREYGSYIGFEASATELRVYEALVPHGLIQTEEYMRLLMATNAPREPAASRDRKVEVRLTRQQRLLGDNPLQLLAVLDESVLHRVIGGDLEVHRRQLEHLVAIAREYDGVRIQVVPFEHAALPGALASFTLMQFNDQPEIAYIETRTGDLYEEPPESEDYRVAHDDLRAAALSETASIQRIEEILASRH